MSSDQFWVAIDAEAETLINARPTTAGEVIEILRKHDPMPAGQQVEDAFWSGDGGDLFGILQDCGWQIAWIEADYYWEAASPSGSRLRYTEGDLSDVTPPIQRECPGCNAEPGEQCRPHCLS